MAKILLFGGTFDPVHNGHLQTARAALQTLHADRVMFIPANTSPHKLSSPNGASAPQHRLAMLRLAIGNDSKMEVSDIELLRPPPSFTIDTLAILRRDRPADTFILLIGADQLGALHNWREINTILETTSIAVLPRPGFAILPAAPENIPDHLWNKVLAGVLDIPQHNISATTIRQRLTRNLPLENQIPDAVLNYIRQYALYGSAER